MFDHAVVIGGSIAGLLTARVLADYFTQVTIIDRDQYPASVDHRKGTPQSRHLHVLLGRGQQIIEAFFPGIVQELEQAGAPVIEWAHDMKTTLANGESLPRFHSGHFTITASRILLEWTIRERLKTACPNIRFIEGHQVLGLLTTEDNKRVTGVRVQGLGEKRETTSDGDRITADFVVDASGRTSKAGEWLEAMGYAKPQESMVNAFLGYGTCWYRRTGSEPIDYRWRTIQSNPPHNLRAGVMFATDDDQWVVTVAGASRDYPPTEHGAFLEYLRTLASTDLYDILKDAEPLTQVYGYQRTSNVWRHYEKLSQWPEHFAILGDAACAFNPVYGQGMTVSAMSAIELKHELQQAKIKGSLAQTGQHTQRRIAKIFKEAWLMATGEDFRYPGTEGSKPTVITRIMHWYFDRYFLLMVNSQEAAQTFIEVMQFLKPTSALLTPRYIWKVLNLRKTSTGASGVTSPDAPNAAISVP